MSYVGTLRLVGQFAELGDDVNVVVNDPAVRKASRIFRNDVARTVRSGSALVGEVSSVWADQRSFRRRSAD